MIAALGVSPARSAGLAATGPTVLTSTTHNMKRRRPSATSSRRQSPGYFLVSPENVIRVPTRGQSASLPVSDTPSAVSLESINSTIAHIERLNAKRLRLEEAQSDAESQAIQRARQAYLSGEINQGDLVTIFHAMQAVRVQGFSARWDEAMPLSARVLLSSGRRGPNGMHGTWHGEAPLHQSEPAPMSGMSVVYVLFDGDNTPCYVGSTKHFRDRLKRHLGDGKPVVRWTAHPVSSRTEAYELEDRLLKQHAPYLNKRAAA